MIFLGLEEKVAASKMFPGLSCPLCHTSGEIEISVNRVQISAAFVPMLAVTSRGGVVQCHHCQQPVKLKLGGEPFKSALRELKSTVRTPLYLYSGLVACLVGLAVIFGSVFYQDRHNPYTQPIEQAQLASPQVGDLYEVGVNEKTPQSFGTVGHTLARVERVGEGVVMLRWHRKMVPIDQKMPFLQDFRAAPSDFGSETMEAAASYLQKGMIVRRGQDHTDSKGSIVATLRPPAK